MARPVALVRRAATAGRATPRRNSRAIRPLVRDWEPGTGPVQLADRRADPRPVELGALRQRRPARRATRLDMMMAYFSPAAAPAAARSADRRGKGDTRLLLAAKTDNGATIGASPLLYGKLLKRGRGDLGIQPVQAAHQADRARRRGLSRQRQFRHAQPLHQPRADAADRGRARWPTGCATSSTSICPRRPAITRELHKRRATLSTASAGALSWFLVSVVDYTVSRRLNLGLD